MADYGARTAGQDSGELERTRRGHGVTNQIDASEHAVKRAVR